MKKLFLVLLLTIFSNSAFAVNSIHAKVNGMVCAFCVKGINKQLRALEATQDVWVDLKNHALIVELKDHKTMTLQAFTKTLQEGGYEVTDAEYINKTLVEIKSEFGYGDKSK